VDTIIHNARWLNRRGEFESGHIVITDGRIAKLSCDPAPASADALDASGMTVLPGAIDSHTHFREPGQVYKEGIVNGSKAAMKGGVTTVLDMPNNKPPCNTEERLAEKRKLFSEKCLVNWGLHIEASAGTHQSSSSGPSGGRLPSSSAVASAKIYMAKSSDSDPITDPETLASVFSRYRVVSIHAEDETLLKPQENVHHKARPKEAIASALDKIEVAYQLLPDISRPRVVLCHVSTALEAQWLLKMKEAGADIWGETCPHYLFFTCDDYLAKGARFKVNTPLRDESDRRAVTKALIEGPVDFLSTDHAPHTPEEKKSDNPPSGIASIEWYLQILLHLVDEGHLTWKRFLEVSSANAAGCYSIQGRGDIREGNWADLVLVSEFSEGSHRDPARTSDISEGSRQDPARTSDIFEGSRQDPARTSDLSEEIYQDAAAGSGSPGESHADEIITKAAFNPYADIGFRKRIRAVFVNGNLCYRDGALVGAHKGMEVYSEQSQR
jgi:dihydroorotase